MSQRSIWMVGVGLLVIQLAWILSLPAFGGIDEYDHVYRASSVAHGQWIAPPADATRGTGAFVDVSPDLVEAARAECQELAYGDSASCTGVHHDDLVRVATGAGRYNPLFYALIGYPSLPFHGVAAVYAMRAVTALLCTVMILAGLLALRSCTRSGWPLVGAIAALDPMVLYSTAIASPNGLEIAAALALWCCGWALLRGEGRPSTWLLAATTMAGALLVTVRSMGPLWCLLIAATLVIATPRRLVRLKQLLGQGAVRLSAAVILAATIAGVTWTEVNSSLVVGVESGGHLSVGEKVQEVLHQVPLWLLQSIGAFPYRNQQAPTIVYVTYLVLGLAVIVIGWRAAGTLARAAGLFCLATGVLLPSLIAYATMDEYYYAWQGRYGLPFSMGVLLIAGFALAHVQTPRIRWLAPGAVLYATAMTASVVHVRDFQVAHSPSYSSGSWHALPALVLAGLVVLGSILLAESVRTTREVGLGAP